MFVPDASKTKPFSVLYENTFRSSSVKLSNCIRSDPIIKVQNKIVTIELKNMYFTG